MSELKPGNTSINVGYNLDGQNIPVNEYGISEETVKEIAKCLIHLRSRIVGFQASNNVFRVIGEEIKRYDPTWDGDFSWQRKQKIVDRNELVQQLQSQIEHLKLELAAKDTLLELLRDASSDDIAREHCREVLKKYGKGE